MNYKTVTLKERPDLKESLNDLHSSGWAEFMREDTTGVKYWDDLLSLYSEFQFLLLNELEEPIACGNSIPFYWDGSQKQLPAGWADVLERGILEHKDKSTLNTLSALAIVIHPSHRGKGISEWMVREMKKLAINHRMKHLIAPVRPSLKSHYPLIPMEDYMNWERRSDGKPFDPWIRTHWKSGARIIKVANKSMDIRNSIQQWEEWTGLKLFSSGSYVIKEGIVPLEVNREQDEGKYIEPNVWMEHSI